jgi:hypothetical protein
MKIYTIIISAVLTMSHPALAQKTVTCPPEVEPTNGAGRLKLRNAMPAVHAAVKRRARPARCHTARYIGRYLITVVDQSALKDRTGVKPEGANPVDHRR